MKCKYSQQGFYRWRNGNSERYTIFKVTGLVISKDRGALCYAYIVSLKWELFSVDHGRCVWIHLLYLKHLKFHVEKRLQRQCIIFRSGFKELDNTIVTEWEGKKPLSFCHCVSSLRTWICTFKILVTMMFPNSWTMIWLWQKGKYLLGYHKQVLPH